MNECCSQIIKWMKNPSVNIKIKWNFYRTKRRMDSCTSSHSLLFHLITEIKIGEIEINREMAILISWRCSGHLEFYNFYWSFINFLNVWVSRAPFSFHFSVAHSPSCPILTEIKDERKNMGRRVHPWDSKWMLFLGVLCPDANKGRKGIASVRLGHKTLSPPNPDSSTIKNLLPDNRCLDQKQKLKSSL